MDNLLSHVQALLRTQEELLAYLRAQCDSAEYAQDPFRAAQCERHIQQCETALAALRLGPIRRAS